MYRVRHGRAASSEARPVNIEVIIPEIISCRFSDNTFVECGGLAFIGQEILVSSRRRYVA